MITRVHVVGTEHVLFKQKKNLTIELSDHMSHITSMEKEFRTKGML